MTCPYMWNLKYACLWMMLYNIEAYWVHRGPKEDAGGLGIHIFGSHHQWQPQVGCWYQQKKNKKNKKTLLGFLWRNMKYSSPNLKNTAHKSLVRCNLEYCSSIWDSYTKDIKQIDQVQRRAASLFRVTIHGSQVFLQWSLNWDGIASSQDGRMPDSLSSIR